MTNANPYLQSLDEEVLSADPIHLVLLLLRGARQSTEQARRALNNEQVRERALAISRAIERIGELCRNLDYERGGEIARRLAALYDYLIYRLNEANMHQTEAPLAEVSALLVPLIEVWSEMEIARLPDAAATGSDSHLAANLCA
ncbi:MAG TPA: flagellar export chaperone FliS [Bryobacteraceae bacterium]|nr:flagellar export chaperone FliS [Bryobacteraceae bacterium]HPT27408.1 flagellar export chaperone FliS [Bryobacteraceae bacterium]